MRIVFLSIGLFFTCGTILGQTFMHGAGIHVSLTTASRTDAELGEGFTYFPRINFIETDFSSVSVGVPISVGFSFSGSYNSRDYYSDETSASFTFNAPLIINLNMGRGSTKENTDKFGYFIGAGFGYHHGDFFYANEYDESYSERISTVGPAANAGARIGVGQQHKNIEIRLSYMKGLNDIKPNIFGLGCSFNF